MTGFTGTTPASWEQEGQRLAPLLDDVYATVVAGADSGVAASIAIGLARAQSARRRVAIADLVGESLPLEALLTGDDPHGVSDSFLHGVSLNKIARAVNASGTMFLMPSGTESVANEAVYANDRWRRLAAGFHQVGALLLVVAVPGTPGFTELCAYIGALMPVGDATFPIPPGIRLIAAPPPAPTAEASESALLKRASTARARAIAAENNATRRRRTIAIVIIIAALVVAVGASWSRLQPLMPAPIAALFSRAVAPPDSTRLAVSPTQTVRVDSTGNDSLRRAVRDSIATDSIVAARPPLIVVNPADSVRAARYAIYFATANTRDAAMPDAAVLALPAVAMSPVPEGNELWYRVTVGAAGSRRTANAMLADLRARKVVGAGSVVNVPYALRLEDSVTAGVVPMRLAEYTRRGIVAYALRQPNGQSVIVTGAFETPTQATMLADSLQKLGIMPVLVYRTGRAF